MTLPHKLSPGDRVEVPGRFADLVVCEVRRGYVTAVFSTGVGWVSMPEACFVLAPKKVPDGSPNP